MSMNLTFKRTSVALLLSLACFTGYAQHAVTGTVKDASGEPLIGVTVMQNGTSVAVTDIDGNFTIPNADPAATLKFSYVGYSDQEVKVGNKNTFNISMRASDKTLDEVVVVGYGTMKRRDLTGSVASVTGEQIAQNPVANIAQALQGQLPGVNVISQDGRPGATMSIRVRGGGSITQSNDPLYVVDGVQVSRIDDIPADEIESIDVLKDAASTAIYGARGANGVILVTTKQAKTGKAQVKYNMYYKINETPDKLDVLDPYDYVMWTWKYGKAYGDSYGNGVAKYFGLGSKYGNHQDEYRNMSTHNYVDDIMKTSHSWNHDLSVSGGTEHTKYYTSVNYVNDDGVRMNTGFRRWNVDMKLAQDITNNLKLDLDARYSEMRFRGARYGYATSAYTYRPVDNPLGVDPNPSDFGQGSSFVEASSNPVDLINNYDEYNDINRLRLNAALTWTPLKGLMAKTELSLGRSWHKTRSWDGGSEVGYSTAKLTKRDGYNVRWATTLNYDVQGLGNDHKLGILLGNEVLSGKTNSNFVSGSGYPEEFSMTDAFANMNMTDSKLGKDEFGSTIGNPEHTTSWFGRMNYSFLSRYLFTATFRADGSSKFAPNHHWGYFPAFAAAWRISDEPFMANTHDWLSNLKLRLSYGTSGNDNINSSLWREVYVTDNVTMDGKTITVYKPGTYLSNEDLKWETTVSRNLGLDFGFWNGKLNGSIDLYWNTTKNILMPVPVDGSTGFGYQFQNVGQTSNRGLEFALHYNIIKRKDFNLNFGMTYNYNKNKVDELFDNALADASTGWGSTMRKPFYDYIIRVGQPVGLVQGYKSAGFYTVNDFNYDAATKTYTLKEGVPDIDAIVNYAGMNNYKRGQRTINGEPQVDSKGKAITQNAFPGMVKFEDINGDGIVNDADATTIGHTMPKHTGGFNISGNWKSLDFSLNFAYQIGGEVYNANVMHDMMGNKDNMLGANRLAELADCWQMYDIDANGDLFAVTEPDALAALNANAKYALPYSEYGLCSSEFIEDASYLRLQNLTIGYTLPRTWMKTIGISNLRVYFTASNLFCLSGYSGLDPDVNTAPGGIGGFPTPNYDYQAYPKTRSYTFGLNVSF